MDYSPPGFTVHGILQASILEWVAMGFSRQAYWSGLPFSTPGHLPDPGIEPGSLTFQADFFTI